MEVVCARVCSDVRESASVPPISKDVNKDVNKRSAADLNCIAHTTLKAGWLNVQSLSNKTGAIHELIDDKGLDVLVLTETWHRSSEDISLRLAAPADFTAVDAVRVKDPAHGGVVFLHRKRHKCTRIALPQLTSFEGLCTRLSVGGESFIFLSIYRPGSSRPSSKFYDELTNVLESLVLNSCPVLIGGDINVHVENATDVDAVRLAEIFASFNLVQHVIGPTHRLGGTLDLVAAFSDCKVIDICVDPPGVISDHGLVTCSVPARRDVAPVSSRVVRSWRSVNRDDLAAAIRSSALGDVPSGDASQLFETYETTLRRLADEYVPLHAVQSRQRPLAPWFDADCRAIRRNCRRLEQKYRRTNSIEDRAAWAEAVRNKFVEFRSKKNEYWTERITGERHMPAKLWRSMTEILRREKDRGESGSHTTHSADAFLEFFENKVKSVRSGTDGYPPAKVRAVANTQFLSFHVCSSSSSSSLKHLYCANYK